MLENMMLEVRLRLWSRCCTYAPQSCVCRSHRRSIVCVGAHEPLVGRPQSTAVAAFSV
jgi:hypothetical protein